MGRVLIRHPRAFITSVLERDDALAERKTNDAGTHEMPMLILVAHGSRDPLWRDSIHDLAEAVGARIPEESVGVAFMQFDGPTLQETLEKGSADGHTSFKLLPLFMASAGHVDKDIKPLVEDLARAHPELELNLLTPVGENGRFPSFIVDILTRSHETG